MGSVAMFPSGVKQAVKKSAATTKNADFMIPLPCECWRDLLSDSGNHFNLTVPTRRTAVIHAVPGPFICSADSITTISTVLIAAPRALTTIANTISAVATWSRTITTGLPGLATIADSIAAIDMRWAVGAGLPGLAAIADSVAAVGLWRGAIGRAALIGLAVVAEAIATVRA